MDELQRLRSKIDELDAKLIEVLAERFRLTGRVGQYKLEHNLPFRDQAREDAQAARLVELAKQQGLDPDLAERLLRQIIDEVVSNHQALRKL
jgi:chorismate mutase